MPHTERINIYQKIEKIRKHPLISYITSSRQNAGAQMASDVIVQITRQLLKIPEDSQEIDLLIISSGGDPTVALRIISMFRERFKKISVLLPYEAYSAATLLALGADEIVMHPFSNLGPVDPQITRVQQGKENLRFGSEDIRNYFEFIRDDVGISDQKEMERSFELLCKEVGAIPIGVAKRSTQLSIALSENLLGLHMKDSNKVKAISEALNKSFYHHGYPLSRTLAKEIGLNIMEPGKELEDLLWGVWEDIAEEMQIHKPLNPLEIVFNDKATAESLGPIPQVQIPQNLDPVARTQVLNNILNQIGVKFVKPIDFETLRAVVESTRCFSHFNTKHKINAVRMPDMNISINILDISKQWNYNEIE